jgi:hypothetical protein
MGFLNNLVSGGLGSLVEQVGGVADKFITTGEEKQRFKLEMEGLLQRREAEIESSVRQAMSAKEKILVAELSQGDGYTKRARPTVVYAGLAFIAFNYCIVPLFGLPTQNLPTEFWVGWSGIVATWSVGRSFEKSGVSNKLIRGITGSRLSRDDDAPKG